jgi:hypothetical protein
MIIGLRGKAGAGKDTVADYLVKEHSYKKLSFATALKKIVVIITGWSYDFVNGATAEFRQQRETLIHPVYGMTCRQLLQYIGTELFRNQLHKDIWITCLYQDALAIWKEDPDQGIVVSDVRFDNEAETILKLGGQIWNIKRDGIESQLDKTAQAHASEADFTTASETVIQNNDTLTSLYKTVNDMLAGMTK